MNGIFLPYPVVILGMLAVAVLGLRRISADTQCHRFGSGAIGTMSFSLGIAAFAFMFATTVPRVSLGEPVGVSPRTETPGLTVRGLTPSGSPESIDAESTEKIESAQSPAKSAAAAAQAELESPIATVKIDLDKRPSWVESAGQQVGDVHTVSVSSGPWATQAECDRAPNTKIQQATDDYIREYLHDDLAPQKLHYDLTYIKKNLLREKGVYHEMLTVSFGQMKQTHALLQFDGSFRHELETRWQRVIASSRLLQTGLVFGGLLIFLGTLFTYFKLDHATRGFYAGRLQFGMAAVILTSVAAGITLAMMISRK